MSGSQFKEKLWAKLRGMWFETTLSRYRLPNKYTCVHDNSPSTIADILVQPRQKLHIALKLNIAYCYIKEF